MATTLPDRETFLANAILRTLRKWKLEAGSRAPWVVTDHDIDVLEVWVANLWDTYEKLEGSLRRSEVAQRKCGDLRQPSHSESLVFGAPNSKVKTCPKCEAKWPADQLLLKCVTCGSVYCPACKDVPSVHPFWCHQYRHGPTGG